MRGTRRTLARFLNPWKTFRISAFFPQTSLIRIARSAGKVPHLLSTNFVVKASKSATTCSSRLLVRLGAVKLRAYGGRHPDPECHRARRRTGRRATLAVGL